ncbi:TRAP transporter small permease [Desulfobacula sp.]
MKINTDRAYKSIAGLDRFASVIERLSLFVSVILGGSMVAIVIAGVIARYAMRNPFAWTEEASRFLMIWMVLIGMSVVTRNRENLCVEFLVIKFPVFFQRIIKLVNEILVMSFLYILMVEGFKMAVNAKVQIVPSLGITMYYPLLCIPAGGLLTMVQLGIQMMIDLLMWNSKISPHKVLIED